MRIETLTVGLFQVNVFLLQDEATGAWAMVDTSETADVVEEVREHLQGQELSTILLTHGHLDHAGALLPLQAAFPRAITVLPALEVPMFRSLPEQGSWFGAPALNRPCGRIDREIRDGEEVAIGSHRLRFLSAPGHTPGQGCFHDDQEAFVGDLLFAGSVGRTDLRMGDPVVMQASLRRLLELPGHLRVHSGHGPDTTLAAELATNPYLGYLRREKGLASGGRDW